MSVLAAFAALSFALSGCGGSELGEPSRYRRNYFVFGTSGTLILDDYFNTDERRGRAVAAGKEVADMLTGYEALFSAAQSTSDVARFNAAAAGSAVELSKTVYDVLSLALDVYEETGGFYNAGVYYSVDLYGFGVRPEGTGMPYDRKDPYTELPADEYVEAFRELSACFGQTELYSEGGRYYAVKPGDTVKVGGAEYSLAIDLSGIAKGYAVDEVDRYIDGLGYGYGSFSFGMSSVAVNKARAMESGEWYLTFRDPRGSVSDYYMATDAADIAVSTSGDYENYYMIDGVRYCHIIDPFTGSPINNGMVTASCLGGTAAEDDARTTAVMAMGLDRAIEYINSSAVKEQGVKLSFVYLNSRGEYLLVTNIPEGEYSVLNENYIPASRLDENGDVVFTGAK